LRDKTDDERWPSEIPRRTRGGEVVHRRGGGGTPAAHRPAREQLRITYIGSFGVITHAMKNIPSLFKLIAGVTLVMLAWCGPAFCGEVHDASQAGDLAKVKALLSTNRDLVSSKDTNGWMPLHYAAMYGHKEVVELLLANKAEINAKDKNGETALHFAAMLGRQPVAEVLLANKAEVDAKDNDGETPLFYAARKEIAELLLKNKADVNMKNKKGFTPLHEAVKGGKKGVVAMLRQHGGHE
jgi:hypothetical protein